MLKTAPSQAARRHRPVYARRLLRHARLTTGDLDALESRLDEIVTLPPRHDLGSRAASPMFIVSGWACLAHSLDDGRRLIIAFLLPGDCIGLDLLTRGPSPLQVLALTNLRVRHHPRAELLTCGRIGAALSGAVAAQQWRLIDQMVRLGRQTAYERMVHLMLELHGRLDEIGQTRGDSFDLPVKQEVIADSLGLSLVHVGRTLQQLRRDGLLALRGSKVTLLDRAALQRAAGRAPQPDHPPASPQVVAGDRHRQGGGRPGVS